MHKYLIKLLKTKLFGSLGLKFVTYLQGSRLFRFWDKKKIILKIKDPYEKNKFFVQKLYSTEKENNSVINNY